MAPAWCAAYIGIPFLECGRDPARGLDCWGLVKLVLEREFGLTQLPDFTGRYHSTRERGVNTLFTEEMARWQQVDHPRPGDVAVLRIAARPRHVGLVVAPAMMLTIDRGTASCIERLDSPRWRGRLEGYYRHA